MSEIDNKINNLNQLEVCKNFYQNSSGGSFSPFACSTSKQFLN